MAGQPPHPDAPRRLHRPRGEREIPGFCGGIAEHFAVDP